MYVIDTLIADLTFPLFVAAVVLTGFVSWKISDRLSKGTFFLIDSPRLSVFVY